MATSYGQLGDIERFRGNWNRAEELYRQCLELSTELQSTWHLAHVNYDIAQLERQRGNEAQAQEHYVISHALFTELGAMKDLERIEQEWEDG